jgi:2-methylisocitrate lyase-like PEP mutase family enzyme
MVPTGKSPDVPGEKLKAYGFSIAIYPSSGMGAACHALEKAYSYVKEKQTLQGSPVPAYDMKQLHELVGFQDVWDFEKRHVETK